MSSIDNQLIKPPCYKVIVRRSLGKMNWQEFNRVIFVISLDNNKYYGDYLHSILHWAKRRFEKINIILCDTLQRYNIAFKDNISLAEAKNIALVKGDNWIQQAQPIFEALNLQPHLDRWDNWLLYNHADYKAQYQDLCHLYKLNDKVRHEFDELFDDIWKRWSKTKGLTPDQKIIFRDKAFIRALCTMQPFDDHIKKPLA